jgi:hypothetical protein
MYQLWRGGASMLSNSEGAGLLTILNSETEPDRVGVRLPASELERVGEGMPTSEKSEITDEIPDLNHVSACRWKI